MKIIFFLLFIVSLNTFAANRQDLKSNIVGIGLSTSGTKTLEFNTASGTARMQVRANYGTSTLQYTEDGSVYKDFGAAIPAYSYQSRTTSYTALIGDAVDASGTITITLPTAVGNTGKSILVSNISTSGTVTVSATGGFATGSATTTLTSPGDTIQAMSNGASWTVLTRENPRSKMELVYVAPTCTASPCTFLNPTGGVSTVTRASAGTYSINWIAGAWRSGSRPFCFPKFDRGVLAARSVNGGAETVTSTVYSFQSQESTNGSATDSGFDVVCWGYR